MKEKTHLTFLDLLKDARDSHLVAKAQFMLLLMLIVRCDPEKDYSCYPGYELLAEDTGLNMKTLKAAAVGLEGKKLVKRRVRPNHSNVWYINAKLLHETAEAKRAAKAEERSERYDDCPFEPPVLKVTSAAAPVPANKDADKKNGSPAEMDPFFARAVSRIRELFPDHPTLQKAGADRFIAQDVEEMLSDTNHTPEAVLKFLSDLSDKAKATIAASSHLGPYLKKCFSDWLEKQRPARIVVSVDGLLILLNDTVLNQSPECHTILGDTELWEELQSLAQQHGGVQHVSDVLCYDYPNQAFADVETPEQVLDLLKTQFDDWKQRVEQQAASEDGGPSDSCAYDDDDFDEEAA
jgi:hypothetical protein